MSKFSYPGVDADGQECFEDQMVTTTPELNEEICEQARLTRDPRFDGRIFIGITSTGIYCRPICPTPHAKRANVRYFPSAAAAEAAGLRPCLRCRPELAPDATRESGTSATVTRALRLIAEGILDEQGVKPLANRLGVSPRHLDRIFRQHLGASPLAVAQTRRVQFAKRLLSDTDLPINRVAFASGFRSLRRFNDVLSKLYGRTPSELRGLNKTAKVPVGGQAYVFPLAYRPPYDWESLLAHLAAHAVPGVEEVAHGAYRRAIAFNGHQGILEVRQRKNGHELEAHIHFTDPAHLLQIVARVRTLFDLTADPQRIAAQLGGDPLLTPLVQRYPGLRVPGAWNGFEMTVQTILDDRFCARSGHVALERFIQHFGEPLKIPNGGGLTHTFPRAENVANARMSGFPRLQADVIRALAREVAAGDLMFNGGWTQKQVLDRLMDRKVIADGAAQYLAMRVFGDPHAFPVSDEVLQDIMRIGRIPTRTALQKRIAIWRPWCAYAALYLSKLAAN